MSGRVILSLAIHNHQPVGNFPAVFEAAYRQAYLPMLEALQQHPRIRVAMHYSGPLLDWLEATHAEFFSRLRALVDRNQVELMTGGYYEPILAVIPDRDKQGQIHKLTDYLQRRLGVRATGLWLAERVWEPHLPQALAAAAVDYTIVDDTHFLAAGLQDERLTGYFVTEEQGATVKIFPSRKRLRYLIPWQPPETVLTYLDSFRRADTSAHDPVLMMGDDGEKFGLWPGTYAHCWEQGWIETFFQAVESASDWLVTMPAHEAAALPAVGRAYLPTASYEEMLEWSGGFWRQFLVKYPEINTMYQRMVRISRTVHAMRQRPRHRQALDELWAGQCNCPYWHGVFGGIYLPHIRRATFGHLIAADTLATSGRRARGTIADLDGDGAADVELTSPAMVVAIDPDEGGSVVEWDWRAERVNLTNVVSRRPEAYHRQLRERPADDSVSGVETIHTGRVRVKEPGLERLLVYDRCRRAGFLDHLLSPQATVESFARQEYEELGDFVTGVYRPAIVRSADEVAASLVRDGAVAQDGRRHPLRVSKRITVGTRAPTLQAAYKLHNPSEASLALRFGVETVWAITDSNTPLWIADRSAPARETRSVQNVGMVRFIDWDWHGAVLLRIPPAEVWVHPLETVSNSEAGFERIFQGVVCLCLWTVGLPPHGDWNVAMKCDLGIKGVGE
jgi:alpha-amylase